MRHFVNRLGDYQKGVQVVVDREFWKKTILSTVYDAILKGQPPSRHNCDGGLYVGCAGIAYMLYYLAKSSALADDQQQLLKSAEEYLNVSLEYAKSRDNRDPTTAFLLGPAGVYAVGALIYKELGNLEKAAKLARKYTDILPKVLPVSFSRGGSDELFVGRAGYICGALALNRDYGAEDVVSQPELSKVCAVMIQSGKEYVSREKHRGSPLMYSYYDTEYLGAAHGLAAVLQMILSCPDFLKQSPHSEKEVLGAVDFMLSIMQPNGNIAPAMDEVTGRYRRPTSEELIHWCHGAPGIVYLFARAYLYWKDEKYLQACIRCGEVTWERGLLKKGPGICHGIAGSGYVFLLLYRLTGDEKYYHRAVKFAEFIFTDEFKQARTPDAPYSLYEGLAGTVCFLADLLQPQTAEFPFFNVFL